MHITFTLSILLFWHTGSVQWGWILLTGRYLPSCPRFTRFSIEEVEEVAQDDNGM
jgi:hypothetical protein